MGKNLIELMLESKNDLLKNQAKSVEKWMKLRHVREDLELLLGFNIANVRYMSKDDKDYKEIICTSNLRLINVYQMLKQSDKMNLLNTTFTGLKTPKSNADKGYVLTYDLIKGDFAIIDTWKWQVTTPFISIEEDNVAVLDKLLNEYLKK